MVSFFVSAKTGDNIVPSFTRIAADLAGVSLSKPDLEVATVRQSLSVWLLYVHWLILGLCRKLSKRRWCDICPAIRRTPRRRPRTARRTAGVNYNNRNTRNNGEHGSIQLQGQMTDITTSRHHPLPNSSFFHTKTRARCVAVSLRVCGFR